MKKPLVSEMSLREKISQCLVGYQSAINRRVEEDFSIIRSEEEKEAVIRREQFGTIWAQTGHTDYDLNKNEYRERKENSSYFCQWLKKQDDCLNIPGLLVSDMELEGAGAEFEDLTCVCPPMAIAAANSEELTYGLGACVAKELKCAGINWRWAPVVDISNRFSAHIMRTYSPDDPNKVIKFANAHIAGIQSQKVAATAKHFPGGDRYEYRDAHFSLTKLNSTLEEWWDVQGKIFQGVIDAGVYSVMVGHVAFPAVDSTKINGKYIPSSISKKVVTELLKEQMGFKGVVVSDALGMAGLTSIADYEDLIVMLIQAGVDVIIGTRLHATDILEKAVLDGRIPESRFDDACQRVLDLKEKLGLFEADYLVGSVKAEDVVEETRRVNEQIARRSITLVRDRRNRLPFSKDDVKRITIIASSHTDFFHKELDKMKVEFEKRGAEVTIQRRLKNEPELREIAAKSDLIIYAAYIAGHTPKGFPSFYDEEMNTFTFAFSVGAEKSIGVSLGYPYIHYDVMEQADIFMNIYGRGKESMKAFVEAVYGEIPIVGESPVKLEPDFNIW